MSEKIFDRLKRFMTKEIAMMREILANMHEEELSLLTSDQPGFEKAMQARSDMVIELRSVRSDRNLAIRELESQAQSRLNRKQLTHDDLLPVEESEVRSLLDQLIALVDRLNFQNARNDHLFYQARSLGKLPLECAYPPPQTQARTARRKVSVATQE